MVTRFVDRITGLPATVYVPPEDRIEVVDCHECGMTIAVKDPRTYVEEGQWSCADCWLDAHPETISTCSVCHARHREDEDCGCVLYLGDWVVNPVRVAELNDRHNHG